MTTLEINKIILEEGDYYEWMDSTDNIHCHIQRNTLGIWCGYVTIPNSFPIINSHIRCIDCHGGVTYDSLKDNGDLVIGFDCGHYGDYVPKMGDFESNILGEKFKQIYKPEGEYRTKQFAIDEVNLMVEQILNIKEVHRHIRVDQILDKSK